MEFFDGIQRELLAQQPEMASDTQFKCPDTESMKACIKKVEGGIMTWSVETVDLQISVFLLKKYKRNIYRGSATTLRAE